MLINEEFGHRMGAVLNEADLLGIEWSRGEDAVACTFAVIAMDKDGQVPEDNRVSVIFRPIGRFVASYRKGHWDDEEAEVEYFEPEQILEIVQRFGGLPIYGWDFINCGDKDFDRWKNRLSFDYSTGDGLGLTNTIDLFQAGTDQTLNVRIWFDDFDVLTPHHEKVDLVEFLENGRRGWDAIYASDEKMQGFGIFPATKKSTNALISAIKELKSDEQPRSWRTRFKDRFGSKR